jgi:hypothetical protein
MRELRDVGIITVLFYRGGGGGGGGGGAVDYFDEVALRVVLIKISFYSIAPILHSVRNQIKLIFYVLPSAIVQEDKIS